jgi:hypothetical protein
VEGMTHTKARKKPGVVLLPIVPELGKLKGQPGLHSKILCPKKKKKKKKNSVNKKYYLGNYEN